MNALQAAVEKAFGPVEERTVEKVFFEGLKGAVPTTPGTRSYTFGPSLERPTTIVAPAASLKADKDMNRPLEYTDIVAAIVKVRLLFYSTIDIVNIPSPGHRQRLRSQPAPFEKALSPSGVTWPIGPILLVFHASDVVTTLPI